MDAYAKDHESQLTPPETLPLLQLVSHVTTRARTSHTTMATDPPSINIDIPPKPRTRSKLPLRERLMKIMGTGASTDSPLVNAPNTAAVMRVTKKTPVYLYRCLLISYSINSIHCLSLSLFHTHTHMHTQT